jgi:hypothetical protein
LPRANARDRCPPAAAPRVARIDEELPCFDAGVQVEKALVYRLETSAVPYWERIAFIDAEAALDETKARALERSQQQDLGVNESCKPCARQRGHHRELGHALGCRPLCAAALPGVDLREGGEVALSVASEDDDR